MPVSIKGTGGGSVTLSAAAAATDTTLTIPNVTGTVLQSGTAVTAAQGGTGLTTPGTSGNVLTSNGSAWTSAAPSGGGQIQYVLFTAGGTWTAPTGVTRALVYCVGAGGGGVLNNSTCFGASFFFGGAGGYAVAFVTVVPGTGYTITIGTAGAGTTGNSSGTITGNSGGTSSFGSLITSTGSGATSVNSNSGVFTVATPGSGTTTGTMLRNGAQMGSAVQTNGSQVLGILAGNSTIVAVGSAANVWSVGALYGPGVGGSATVAASYGGCNGAILIQYVG